MTFHEGRPRVLLARAGGLGDLLLLRTAIASLRAGGFSPWLLAPHRHGTAVCGPQEADGLLDWEAPAFSFLWTTTPDSPASSEPAPLLEGCAAAVVYSASADLILGLQRTVPAVLVQPPVPTPGCHASAWLAAPILAMTGALVEPPTSRPTITEAEAAAAVVHSLPTGFLAIHPGSGASRKNWPAKAFGALARTVSPTQPWLLVEGPADSACCEALRGLPDVRVARDLQPRVLGAVLACAGVYVGNDSGVSHLAAAWGAPTVALFGPSDPSIWAPLGRSVEVVRAPGGDLEALPVDEVIAAIARLAQRPRPGVRASRTPTNPHS